MKDPDENSHIGNYTTEAFALLIIMNNYKAWLHEEKMKHQEKLITEYEIDTHDLRVTIVDHWLKDLEIKRTGTGEYVILDDNSTSDYISTVQARRDRIECRRACRRDCELMMKSWGASEISEGSESTNNENDQHTNVVGRDILKEREKKRRKLMKSLRRWTGSKPLGQKAKGWSDEGHQKYENLCDTIRKEVADGKYKSWDKQIRMLYNKKESQCQADGTAPPARYLANKSVVWEL